MSNRKAKNITYKDFLTSDLLENEGISSLKLKIPEFQRNYVWKNDNIIEFFNSIEDNEPGYYSGSIVIVANEDGSSGRDKIVDGQQRLVTLSFISKAIYDSVSNDEMKEDIKKILFQGQNLKIIFQREGLQSIYEKVIRGEVFDEKTLNKSQKKLLTGFNIIKKEISEIDDLESFFNKLELLEFVVIKCPDDNDAYQLFEGLNSTGLSLSAIELTKNSILGFVKKEDQTKLVEINQKWEAMEKSFEMENPVFFSKFIRHHWFFEGGYVSNSRLFKEIKEKKIINMTTVGKYINELVEDSRVYLNFRLSNLNKRDFNEHMDDRVYQKIPIIINHFGLLKLDQIYSVLFALYKQGKFTERYFLRDSYFNHIEGLWAFIFLVNHSKISPSSFERKFASLCKDIGELQYSEFKIRMKDFFKDLHNIVLSVDKKDFSKKMSESLNNNESGSGLIRYLLREYLLSTGGGEDPDQTTEHIIPKSNFSNWSNINNPDAVKGFVEKLGNLTLLNKTLNESIEDKAFAYKNENGYAKSSFVLNNKLFDDWGDKFNSEDPKVAIVERGMKISEIIYDLYIGKIEALSK
ncbi:MAG: DUF262 domain-containing HNH endonuclease family protein [Patescibacteria group bacterium]